MVQDPEKQFMMLVDHIQRLRSHLVFRNSDITIFVEHNLGFEAEHHERALRGLPGVKFYYDHQRQRMGVLTTLPVKHAMCTLTNTCLREKRICLHNKASCTITGLFQFFLFLLSDYSQTFFSLTQVGSRYTDTVDCNGLHRHSFL